MKQVPVGNTVNGLDYGQMIKLDNWTKSRQGGEFYFGEVWFLLILYLDRIGNTTLALTDRLRVSVHNFRQKLISSLEVKDSRLK